MAVSYTKLWKLLIDKDMKKKELDELTYVLKMLAEKGEKPTFRYLRKKVWKDRWKK